MSKHGCRLLRLSLDINVRSRRRLCRCGRRRRPHKFVAISCFVISYRASSVTPRTSTPERPIVLPPPSWPRRALMPLLNSPNHFLASLSAQDSELLYPHLKPEQFQQELCFTGPKTPSSGSIFLTQGSFRLLLV